MKFKTNLKIKSNIIDPVPFVDMLFLFIIFFLLTGQSIGRTGIILNLPKVEQTDLYKADCAVISLVGEKVFLDEKEIEPAKIRGELENKKGQLLAIKADRDISHSMIIQIISIAKEVGIEQIAIATEDLER